MEYKKLIICGFVVGALSYGVAAEKTKSAKPKMAHMHESKHDGKIYMLGDVHFEVTGDPKMIMIYSYDRYGDDMDFNKLDIKLALVELTNRRDLKFVKDKKETNLVHVMLPSDLNKDTAVVELKAKNVDLPKGQSVAGYPLKIKVKDIHAKDGADPHAGHNM
ncbi:MAG: hypothetical protein R3A80_11075 [Bdellovibrionota bacterium]